MYKKVLYNIKKIKKKNWGEGEGQYLNPKHCQCFKKKNKKSTKKVFLAESG